MQSRNGFHPLLGHIMLCEHYRKLLCAVVAVVEENHGIVGLDCAVDCGVVDRLDKLVGDILVVALLHGLHHIGGLLALAFYQEVVGHFHAVPALVAVHGVVAAHNRGDCAGRLVAMGLELFYEAFARTGIGVAAVHEAVDVDLCEAILLCQVAEGI